MKGLAKSALVSLAVWAVLGAAWELGRVTADRNILLKRNERVRLNDLGELQRFRQANAKLSSDSERVVFFGDSITYRWDLAHYFPSSDYVNRGIEGQTSADMLVRFRQDVIDLKPKSVVILAGINDFIWRNEGSDTDEQTLQNLESNDRTMAELAEFHQIHPIFVSLLPVHDYTKKGRAVYSQVPQGAITSANQWLKTFCAQRRYLYLDDYGAMVDERGRLRKELSEDGIHPNEAGYRIMAEVFSKTYPREQQ